MSVDLPERTLLQPAPPPLRPPAYKAKVDRVSPPSRRTTFERYDSCFLGVSLENDSFTTAKLGGIVQWIARRFSRCTVLVGDSIHRISLATTRGMSPDVALAEALRLGDEFVETQRPVFDAWSSETTFTTLRCSEVATWPDYAEFRRRLDDLFETDPCFRASVEAFGLGYHAKRWSGPDDELRRRVRASCTYFLEEFAVFASLRRRGLAVMVYPGSFSTLAEIANGSHPGAPAELRDLTVVSLNLRGR